MKQPGTRLKRRSFADTGESGPWPDSVSPLLRRLYAARGATVIEQAQPRLAQLLPPDTLSGLDAATALLADAIAAGSHIVVVGDFDCDGATACAVGVRGLRLLGARRVSHAVPNRMVHGYGLSPALVEEIALLQPDVLVTVDHGIACHAGITAAKARGADAVLVDTAGRLHTKSNLMAELEKMKRTAAKVIPGAPHDILLVLDATTGQNGLAQARQFTQAVGVTGIVLTKLDGTAKGGIVVAIARTLGLPIRYLGVGEQADDLLDFDPEAYVASLFD